MIYVPAGKIDLVSSANHQPPPLVFVCKGLFLPLTSSGAVAVSVRKLRRIVCVTPADLSLISPSDDKEGHFNHNEFGT